MDNQPFPLLSFMLLAFLGFFLFFAASANAQVVINEFSSNSSPEWVELYNTTLESIDLTGWELKDEKQDPKPLSGTISASGYMVFEYLGRWLNNSGGDKIMLKNSSGTVVDEIVYGRLDAVVGTPDSGKSASRMPNASDNWQNNTDWSKNSANPLQIIPPTNNPVTEPTAAADQKATYKINEVYDGEGNKISSVKVYVDGVYSHHYAPETYTFCETCNCDKCDSDISLNFGSHTFRLEKSGYEDWSETKTINAGNSYEVNPVMSALSSQTISTKTPTKKVTPTSKSQVKSLKSTSAPTSENRSEEEDGGGIINLLRDKLDGSENEPEGEVLGEEEEAKGRIPLAAGAFIISGLAFLGAAGYPFYKNKLKALIDTIKSKKS